MKVSISFDNPNLIPYYKNVKDNIQSFTVSPTGKRALFDARGDIFSVPAESGITENLTESQGVREIFSCMVHQTENTSHTTRIRLVSMNFIFWKIRKELSPVRLHPIPLPGNTSPLWSPDSHYLLFSDRTLKLRLADAATGKIIDVDHATSSEIRSYNFSPDSRWITYTKEGSNEKPAIWVYEIPTGKKTTDNRWYFFR